MGMFDFVAGADANSPQSYNAMQLRQRIAMQMLAQGGKRGYPRNVGEGLTAIGDAIGERAQMEKLVALQGQIDAQQAKEKGAVPAIPEMGGATPPAPATSSDAGASVFDTGTTPVAATPAVAQAAPAQAAPVQVADASGTTVPLMSAGAPPTPPPDDTPAPNPLTGTGSLGPSSSDVAAATSANIPAQRARMASIIASRPTAQGVPQANPTLPGGDQPPSPATPTPIPGAGGQPNVTSDIPKAPDVALVPGAQIAQARTRALPPNQIPRDLPPGIKPIEAPAEPQPPVPDPNFVRPPQKPPPSAQLMEIYRRRDMAQDPQMRDYYNNIITEAEKRREEAFAPVMKDWETRNDPARKLELEAAQRKAQQDIKDIALRNRLGDVDPKTYEGILTESKKQLSSLTGSTAAIQRARALVPQMFHGLEGADANIFLQRLMVQSGLPMDPRLSPTEQFKTAMGAIAGQQRTMIVGPGSQSDSEGNILREAAGADTKLTPQTIMAALDAAEKLNFKMAVAHQKMTRLYAGEDDADRQRMIHGFYGIPDLVNMVPQDAANKLIRLSKSGDTEALREFDNTFNTPGLAANVLRYRRYIEPQATPYQAPQTRILGR